MKKSKQSRAKARKNTCHATNKTSSRARSTEKED